MGSWNTRGNQYIEFVRVLYCKLPTNGEQLPAFPLEVMTRIEPRSQRWEASKYILKTLPMAIKFEGVQKWTAFRLLFLYCSQKDY